MRLKIVGFWGGYPAKNAASSGYLLEHDGFYLLIDCGSGVLAQLQNYIHPTEIDAAIISHYHPDHTADIGVYQHALLIQKFLGKGRENIPIYGHAEDQAEFGKLSYKDLTKGVQYTDQQTLTIGPFEVSLLRTKHPVPCFAMRIECEGKVLVYTADSSYIPEFTEFAKNADILLCECNFYAGMDGSGAGHMNSTDAGQLANDANVKMLILTHLPHFGELKQLVKEASQRFSGTVRLAETGMELEFLPH
ncbi:MBL fold metallo-hydrolase [Peribacillus alkalitolerans]|uniref:MBL fold metallo-hydrolase n=1 Tax=Peribacillus alkalitolerans TaxID=1550385 RepID=UPI0013D1C836|nr:MBL fold metallo-hydrolase [Peribacillus alkalitolerans]